MVKYFTILILFFCIPCYSASTFTITMIPDSQYDVLAGTITFGKQCQWIVDNKDIYNIQSVVHVGDLTQNGSQGEYDNAEPCLKLIRDANIPLMIAEGNHDTPIGTFQTNITTETYYSGKSWFSGDSYDGHEENSYFVLTIDSQEYLFITVQWEPTSAILAWARDIVASYPDAIVIFLTHVYMYDEPEIKDIYGRYIYRNCTHHFDNNTLVLCGHFVVDDGTGLLIDTTESDYQLTTIIYNRQDVTGEGWIRLITFDPDNEEILVKSYSVINDTWDTDADMQYTIDYIKEDSSESSGISNITVNGSVIKGIGFK